MELVDCVCGCGAFAAFPGKRLLSTAKTNVNVWHVGQKKPRLVCEGGTTSAASADHTIILHSTELTLATLSKNIFDNKFESSIDLGRIAQVCEILNVQGRKYHRVNDHHENQAGQVVPPSFFDYKF